MRYINEQENNECLRVGSELLEKYHINDDNDKRPKVLSKKITAAKQKEHDAKYREKSMHSYFYKKLSNDPLIDMKISNSRPVDKKTTSHFEAYINTIHDQEIPTKFLINKREKDNNQEITCNNKCRLCKNNVEDVNHIISGCSMMSTRYYLPVRHDVVARTFLNAVLHKNHPDCKHKLSYEPEYVIKIENYEYWWNLSIETGTKLPHNKPDLIIWDHDKKVCNIIEFSCPSDVNIISKMNEKTNKYAALIRNMQIMHSKYKFTMIPIVIGALGYVPVAIVEYIKLLGFNDTETRKLVRRLQAVSAAGTVKIAKTFLQFSK